MYIPRLAGRNGWCDEQMLEDANQGSSVRLISLLIVTVGVLINDTTMRPSKLHALPFVLLLIAFKCAHCIPCNVCLDGSTMTKPDYLIGIKTPIVLNTCKDVSDALSFVDNDSYICKDARYLSALCGCPVAENACSLCEASQNITKPQQLLDGLVDFDSDFLSQSGLALTCALAESRMKIYQTGQAECLELPFDDLRRYCGCQSDDEEESNECTLCPGGETVPAQSGLDTLINIGNEGAIITCEEAKVLVAQTEKGTEVCNEIQRVSTRCGCPIPDNACRLCKSGGSVTETGTMITTPSGESISCESFEAQLHNFESSSINCTRLDDETYADKCGCSEAEAFVPCSLCVGGEAVPFPEKEITGIEGDDGDYVSQTCGTAANIAVVIPESSQECKWVRLASKLCGCKPRSENTCTLCGGGDIMTNPFQEVVFTFGATNDIYPEDFRDFELFSTGRESTCEFAESVFSSFYTQDDSRCYWNQLLRGQACGCPDNSQIRTLVWTQRCSGILSLSGSLIIIVSIITKPRKVRWSPYNQIVLGISFFDSLSSAAYIIATAFGPKELGLHGSIGNKATCGFQGWLFQIGIASVYYSVLLCVYFLLVVKYNWTERKFSKVTKWVHLGVVAAGLIMAFAVIPFTSPDWRWCYIDTPPQAASWMPGIFFFIVPVALCIVAMTVLTAVFVRYVLQVYRKTQSKTMKEKGKGQKRRSLASRTVWQSVWFLTVFYAVWPIQFAAFVVPTVPSNYWIYLLAAILGPLQGFLNALVVFCRDKKSIQRRVSQNTKKLLSRFSIRSSIRFTSAGSSEVVVADLAGGKEAKQAVEYSIGSKEAAQLETGVGQLDKLEEEEEKPPEAALNEEGNVETGVGQLDKLEEEGKTPEAALNEEGDVSDEGLDESDEGLLEHAINAGLLNDYDRKIFRKSIARIERRPSRFGVE
jgi:hypothetical protein